MVEGEGGVQSSKWVGAVPGWMWVLTREDKEGEEGYIEQSGSVPGWMWVPTRAEK